ncbi:hypothetical protein Pcinc_000597 [Petrolisthes cinctipes]|uniref:Uncharacterized protein n=1 Tax=Petrolisthes cinctipes TaxID=88211 RepID=A0AAE1L3W0_PETCI|nr:hypothetical protein Pcinc_000597 [Petrolisthes cinctipes]
MTKLCIATTSNYTQGFILSYLVGRIFGCTYLTSQLFMKTFADSVVANSPFFINKESGKELVTLSYSKMKLVLKSSKNRKKLEKSRLGFDPTGSIMTYLASFLGCNGGAIATDNAREIIVNQRVHSDQNGQASHVLHAHSHC